MTADVVEPLIKPPPRPAARREHVPVSPRIATSYATIRSPLFSAVLTRSIQSESNIHVI